MAESKTYKGKKNGYYPETPGPHTAGRWEYMVTPFDKTNTLDMQNEPRPGTNTNPDQFGRKDGKSEAD